MSEPASHPTTAARQIHLTRRSPHYWRVTIDHPPLNIFGPDTIPQLDEAIRAIDTDANVKVVVFDSAVEGYFRPTTISWQSPRRQPVSRLDPWGWGR
jgi:1,4-dihydroxy-2-naphthoyl-CoA synthase